MTSFNRIFGAIALGLAVAASVSPALANTHPHHAQHAEHRHPAGYYDIPSSANNGGGYPITAARADALRECTAVESQYPEYEWGVQEYTIYRACMAEHGQME
jgi:hypothetical protein